MTLRNEDRLHSCPVPKDRSPTLHEETVKYLTRRSASYKKYGALRSGSMNEWLAVVLEEYKALRAEVLLCITLQRSIVQMGFATIAIFATFGFYNWEKEVIASITFLVLIPMMSYLFMLLIADEVCRVARLGRYILGIEEKVNISLAGKPNALGWETWLIAPVGWRSRHEIGSTISAVCYGIALLAIVTSIVSGITAAWEHLTVLGLVGIVASEAIVFAGCVGFGAFQLLGLKRPQSSAPEPLKTIGGSS